MPRAARKKLSSTSSSRKTTSRWRRSCPLRWSRRRRTTQRSLRKNSMLKRNPFTRSQFLLRRSSPSREASMSSDPKKPKRCVKPPSTCSRPRSQRSKLKKYKMLIKMRKMMKSQ